MVSRHRTIISFTPPPTFCYLEKKPEEKKGQKISGGVRVLATVGNVVQMTHMRVHTDIMV